jgi:hypothetical protein
MPFQRIPGPPVTGANTAGTGDLLTWSPLMRFLLCAVLAVSVTACLDTTVPKLTPAPPDIVGDWTLTTVNGDSLPYTLGTTSGTTEIWQNEVLTLNADGSMVQEGNLSFVTAAGTTTNNYLAAGTFTVTGSNIAFSFGGGSSSGTGSYSGNTLNMSAQGLALVYVRQ